MTSFTISRSEHVVSRQNIHPDALKVMYRLVRKGFTAYLVGGGVRDLLLGRTPKDFDVSTNATPSQIKKIFQNCFLIGRRFRLAHIRFDDHVIETSTFRRCPDQDDESGDDDLYMLRDNCYGTPEEDALRRDFTISTYTVKIIIISSNKITAISSPKYRGSELKIRQFCQDFLFW